METNSTLKKEKKVNSLETIKGNCP